MRKRWLIIPAVVVALAVALVGGVVLAGGVGDGGKGKFGERSGEGFVARVASILGLGEDTVSDAMEQAKQEMYAERLEAWLDEMVEAGKITQAQADEYKDWLENRPEGLGPLEGKGFGGHHKFRGKGRWGKGDWDKDSWYEKSESESDST